jgi:hypothetical protein
MKEENSIDSGVRNIGRFFLSLIPWAIAIGLTAWLAVWIGLSEYRKQIEQEKRRNVYTDSEIKPKEKIKLDVLQKSCIHITTVDFDYESIVIYTRNDCGRNIQYVNWNVKAFTKNGTAIATEFCNTGNCASPEIGKQAECIFPYKLPADDRIDTVRVWISDAQ